MPDLQRIWKYLHWNVHPLWICKHLPHKSWFLWNTIWANAWYYAMTYHITWKMMTCMTCTRTAKQAEHHSPPENVVNKALGTAATAWSWTTQTCASSSGSINMIRSKRACWAWDGAKWQAQLLPPISTSPNTSSAWSGPAQSLPQPFPELLINLL